MAALLTDFTPHPTPGQIHSLCPQPCDGLDLDLDGYVDLGHVLA